MVWYWQSGEVLFKRMVVVDFGEGVVVKAFAIYWLAFISALILVAGIFLYMVGRSPKR